MRVLAMTLTCWAMKASISDMEAIFPSLIGTVVLGGAAISAGDLFETLTIIAN